MVTVYTLDGDDLVRTHYWASGNTPRMKAALGESPDELRFMSTGAGNPRSPADAHMHDLTIWFVDANHLKTEWVEFKNGRPGEAVGFDFTRSKG